MKSNRLLHLLTTFHYHVTDRYQCLMYKSIIHSSWDGHFNILDRDKPVPTLECTFKKIAK